MLVVILTDDANAVRPQVYKMHLPLMKTYILEDEADIELLKAQQNEDIQKIIDLRNKDGKRSLTSQNRRQR